MTIDEQISNIDRSIKEHEAALEYLNEKRRELVNRGNLNKCRHNWHRIEGAELCILCDETREITRVYRHG